jgi:hypothetical protein
MQSRNHPFHLWTRRWGVSLLLGLTVLGCLTPAFAGITITGGSRDVSTLYVTVNGTLTSVGTIGMWYEVRQGVTNGVLLDYGARKAESAWSITVRHLKFGTNWLVVRTKNSSGVFESAAVALNLVETVPPTVRPRPRPSEIWWGGLSDNSQLLDPTKPWNFVKQNQDGYFIHSAQDWGDLTSSERTQLAGDLKPYNTKFMIEVGGRSDATTDWPDLHTSRTRAGYWKTVATAEGNGIYFSEVTHDYHADDIVEFCRLNPSWPAGDQLAVYTGDYGAVTTNVPVPPPAIGWGEVFPLLLERFPYAKVAQSYSPIYFKWQSYLALSTDNQVFNPLTTSGGVPILVNGQEVSFAFNMYDIHRMMLTSCTNAGQPQYAFATDCPWQATGNWSVQSRRLSNREKIRTYEAYLQGRSAKHYRICNDNSVGGTGDAYDNEYKRDSLKVLYLHQNEGGRSDKYIFESWYGEVNSVPYIGRPYTAAPETKPGSFSNLALDAIKYLKGIRTNGTLESLALIVTPVGSNYQIQLRNDGDIACLPAVQAVTSGNPLISLAFTNYSGANVTTSLKSAEGYTFARPIASDGENDIATKLLQPGETATLGTLSFVVPPGAGAGGALNVALEAYWNPQDPTGVIRDRVTLTVNSGNSAPVVSTIPDQIIFANTNTGPLAFTIGDDLTAPASLTLGK